MNVWTVSQDIPGNRSSVGWEVWIDKTGYSPTLSSSTANRLMQIDGVQVGIILTTGFDFTGAGPWKILNGTNWVNHDADGTKSSFPLLASATYDLLGTTDATATGSLPAIPRASTATFSPSNSLTTGTSVTINTNRASTSFTHDITYSFQGATGSIATAVGASTTWTPSATLLTQIPNSASGSGTISVVTKNGSTVIGTKTTAFTLTAASSVIPTWTSVGQVEAVTTPNVNTIVGKYVKNVSKITGTITSAAGVQGSTIASQKFTVAGQTVTGASGTTPNTIGTSGASVPVVFTITDSRGRVKTQTNNIEVLAYSAPSISALKIMRADASGIADPNGTRIRVELTAAASSLLNTTERNRLTIMAYTSPRGANSWTLRTTPVSASTTLTYASNFAFGTVGDYLTSTAYDVKIEVIDQFNTTPGIGQLTVAAVFQHWSTGLGVGKFWEAGMLDVAGDINSTGKVTASTLRLTSTTDLSLTSTGHAFQVGADTGANVAIDGNEIMARNNGAASQLNVNIDGGSVTIGSTTAPAQIAVRGYFIQPDLPDPLISVGPNAFTITAAAATFASVTGMSTLSFGTLPRSLMVEVQFSGQAATTSITSYTRIGVATSGGLSTTATQDGYGNDTPGYTPFSANLDTTGLYGSMVMTIPVSSTTFTFQAMRLLATGTNSIGYAVMKVIPLRWI
jgi:hypothetical protein